MRAGGFTSQHFAALLHKRTDDAQRERWLTAPAATLVALADREVAEMERAGERYLEAKAHRPSYAPGMTKREAGELTLWRTARERAIVLAGLIVCRKSGITIRPSATTPYPPMGEPT
ncbi:MAG: hypothetical protein FJX76_16585 [Armatimonadetes bacterium]|nr:hypothetical protein [Armatimonadota bacterium]